MYFGNRSTIKISEERCGIYDEMQGERKIPIGQTGDSRRKCHAWIFYAEGRVRAPGYANIPGIIARV